MGLENDVIYVNIIDGKFAMRTTADDPQGTRRINMNNEEVYERLKPGLKGKLVSINTKVNTDFGKSWLFTIVDDEADYQLRVPFTGRLPEGFLLRLPNVNLSLPVTFRIFTDPEGKVVTYIRQQGKTVPKYWNKENDYLELPQLKDIVHANGIPGKDGTARMEYVYNFINNLDSLKNICHATQ
jgi:hypothetical protein